MSRRSLRARLATTLGGGRATAPSEGAPGASQAVGSALVWNLASQLVTQLVSTVVFLLLARELSPAAFGVFALALIFVEAFATEARSAITDTLLMRRDFSPRALSSALIAGMAGALAVWSLLALLAPSIGTWLDAPRVGAMLPWLGVTILLAPAQAVYEALALKALAFDTLAKRNMLASLLAAGTALAALGLGSGDWALVVQRLVLAFASLALLVAMTRWRPSAAFDLDLARGMIRPFAKLWLGQMINFASGRAVDLIIGLKLGVTALGVFRVAGRLVEVAQALVTRPLVSVGLPMLTRHPAGSAEQAEQYREIVSVSALLAAPALAGLALVAPELIAVLLDPRYASAGPVLALLALAALVAPVSYLRGVALTAAGRAGVAALLAICELALLIGFVWVGALSGLVGAVAGVAAASWTLAAVGAVVLARVIGLPLRQLLGACGPAFLPCLTMAAVVLLLRSLPGLDDARLRLVLMVAAGGATYISHLALLHRRWTAARLAYVTGRGRA